MTTTEPSPTSTALAQRDNSPKALVQRYEDSFAAVLPRSVIPDPASWIRIAQGALKKGRMVQGTNQTELEVAATNNPGVFLAALLDAARMGLEPGTEQYYLTPRKVKGKLEILGIVGYQGIVEMIYRAGFVSSVVVEVVRQNDVFSYSPGRDEIPTHEIDWDSDDRGPLRLVYAYARMKAGGFSKVVVLNRASISLIKSKSQGANSDYSPWVTNEEAMWLKSAARQLRKWVPTSSEQRGVALATIAPSASPLNGTPATAQPNPDLPPIPEAPTEFADDDEVVDAEIVDDDEPGVAPGSDDSGPCNEGQQKAITSLLRSQSISGPMRFTYLTEQTGRDIGSLADLTADEAGRVIETLQGGAGDEG